MSHNIVQIFLTSVWSKKMVWVKTKLWRQYRQIVIMQGGELA